MISKATGIQIVAIQGPNFQRCGIWKPEDIDQNIADFAPADRAQVALDWIMAKFTDAGVGEYGMTATQEASGRLAMLWKLVIEYLEASEMGGGCPDGCATPEQIAKQIDYARRQCCEALTALGFTEDSICRYTRGSGSLNGIQFSAQSLVTNNRSSNYYG